MRQQLAKIAQEGRIVVKIGSGVLADETGRVDPKVLRRITNELVPLLGLRRWVYVVSSGAIATGMGIMGLKTRPRTMPGLQAAAAVGQSKLMEAWSQAFARHQLPVAQVLLTHADLANRKRFLNARRALGELQKRRAVPIINENDTVSFEEIAFGDNDELAAQVSNLVDAKLLIMMSVASGILDQEQRRISSISAQDPLLDTLAQPGKSRFGSGGMVSKLRAARVASARGAWVAILDGSAPGAIASLLVGEDVGTVLAPAASGSMPSRDHWIVHTLRPAGTLVVDPGAAKAVGEQGRSLLPSGIRSVRGDFAEGDPVEVAVAEETGERALARGLVRYSAEQLRLMQGRSSREIMALLGFTSGEAVHRDDLVLLERAR